MSELPVRRVTLRELVEAMASYRDDEVFRWYTMSRVGPGGVPTCVETVFVTVGQARAELGVR